VEAVYGLTFGSLYLFSGGNLFVPIACHFLYDFATFLEVHVRSTSRFGAAAAGASTPAARSNGINGSASTELDRKVRVVLLSYVLAVACSNVDRYHVWTISESQAS
jgi:membrane protease YdiL (CAAX protease family)